VLCSDTVPLQHTRSLQFTHRKDEVTPNKQTLSQNVHKILRNNGHNKMQSMRHKLHPLHQVCHCCAASVFLHHAKSNSDE